MEEMFEVVLSDFGALVGMMPESINDLKIIIGDDSLHDALVAIRNQAWAIVAGLDDMIDHIISEPDEPVPDLDAEPRNYGPYSMTGELEHDLVDEEQSYYGTNY